MGRITSSSATIERLAVVAASQIIGLAAAFDGPLAAAERSPQALEAEADETEARWGLAPAASFSCRVVACDESCYSWGYCTWAAERSSSPYVHFGNSGNTVPSPEDDSRVPRQWR